MPLLQRKFPDMNDHIGFIRYMGAPGGSERWAWTIEQLFPYVVYAANVEHPQPYFGGLVFEAGCCQDYGLISPRYLGMTEASTQEGWAQSIEELFRPRLNLSAALIAASELPKAAKLDIWIALPYPASSDRSAFGSIEDRELAFSESVEDRVIALHWWVDLFLERWVGWVARSHHTPCRLQGFVWMKNSLAKDDHLVIASLAKHLQMKQLKLMWCQNYGTARAVDGYRLGIDLICTRPTYAGTKQREKDWVEASHTFSEHHRFGVILWEPTGERKHFDCLLSMTKKHAPFFHLYELGLDHVGEWYRLVDARYRELFDYMRKTVGGDGDQGDPKSDRNSRTDGKLILRSP